MAPPHDVQVVIPVKSFTRAKARLAPALSASARAALAREMATGVVRAAGDRPAWVVCDDPEVADWARTVGCGVCWRPGTGLNGAVDAAVAERFAAGATRVVVVHSDLPLLTSLDAVTAGSAEVVLAPDRHGSGTNVVSTPTASFRFAYGPGSFDRHLAEAERLGLEVRVVRDRTLGWDVDEPADLEVFGPTPG